MDGTLILRFLYNLKLDKENYSLWYISYWNPSLFLNNHFVAIDKNRIFYIEESLKTIYRL